MPLEQALYDVFQKLQQHLNNSHCAVRSMAMSEDQSMDEDDDFKDLVKYNDIIQDDTDGMIELFKDLKSISKQVLGKPPQIWKHGMYIINLKAKKRDLKKNERSYWGKRIYLIDTNRMMYIFFDLKVCPY